MTITKKEVLDNLEQIKKYVSEIEKEPMVTPSSEVGINYLFMCDINWYEKKEILIKDKPNKKIFYNQKFAKNSIFGNSCVFIKCEFGSGCEFGSDCEFGSYCIK